MVRILYLIPNFIIFRLEVIHSDFAQIILDFHISLGQHTKFQELTQL